MNKPVNEYLKLAPWSIIEEHFEADRVKSSESLFSIGNGSFGQRANFEEDYSGDSFQGSYLGGIYYPDKTKVGWWKNGYPKYFAKVLNATNWIGIHVNINDEVVDLAKAAEIVSFNRQLNMQEGVYTRSCRLKLHNGVELSIRSKRFISMANVELGAIEYSIEIHTGTGHINIKPYLDGGILNTDANWDERFWNTTSKSLEKESAFLKNQTKKTGFEVVTGMKVSLLKNGTPNQVDWIAEEEAQKVSLGANLEFETGDHFKLYKFCLNCTSLNHSSDSLLQVCKNSIKLFTPEDFNTELEKQRLAWAEIWENADIIIEGDLAAQQGIRYNIFQLNQTYSGKDPRLNIGPKGFTGEKYGGSTYWDTEAYCFPFYLATKGEEVARNLLIYRYEQLDKAIENASKLGFDNGAALYPMVTMDGTECHNEWEITFEEIHRNGAIVFAIFNHLRYTGDPSYINEKGIFVLLAVARFWAQRVNFSHSKQQYVMLGVTGPNEYENNVNNNWYTNYIATWCLDFANQQIKRIQQELPTNYARFIEETNFNLAELDQWKDISENMYFPYDQSMDIFLQQDGFLDKIIAPADALPSAQRPINQHWSWDRILRSCYIKQGDVLQGFYFFEDHFSQEQLAKHFEYYEPITVHESSLSPCIHSILAAKLDKMDQAYEFYLRTSRLDLDDYNKEIEEGCHITSMAGTWLSIVEGFGGMRIIDDQLHFNPKLPSQWKELSFKILHRKRLIELSINAESATVRLLKGAALDIVLKGENISLSTTHKKLVSIT